MTNSEAVTDGVTYLKSAASKGSGLSVYDHLAEALSRVLELKPANPLSIFETAILSTAPTNGVSGTMPTTHKKAAADAAKTVAAVQLFGEPKPKLNEEGEPEELPEPDEYAFFEPEAPEVAFTHLPTCGKGVSSEELYGILMAMKKLGSDAEKKVEALRFFGKLYGLRQDYYVFECRMTERPEKEEAEEKELLPGQAPPENETGCNKYMYYACNTLGGKMTLLEDVTPDQIKVARGLRKFLVGDFNAPVSTYPPFPGKEKHYLRAQIARIAHATTLIPKGLYTMEEEAEEPEAVEEPAPIDVSIMHDASNWCHWVPHVKAMGVTVLPEIPEPEDEDNPPELLPEQTEKGPRLLTTADNDCKLQGMRAWVPITSSCSRTTKNPVAGVQSTSWPGAIALTDGKLWFNAYFGWGCKREADYKPPNPPPMQDDLEPMQEKNSLPPPPPPPEAEEE